MHHLLRLGEQKHDRDDRQGPLLPSVTHGQQLSAAPDVYGASNPVDTACAAEECMAFQFCCMHVI